MSLEGEIAVNLTWDGRHITGVGVESTRPLLAPRLLTGKTPAQVQALVPALFSLCGQAQAAAAELALAAAQGASPDAGRRVELEQRVVAENLAELFWRLLLDWPQLMGQAFDPAPVAQARKLVLAALATEGGSRLAGPLREQLVAIAARHVFGEPVASWLERTQTAVEFDAWLGHAATPVALALAQLRREFPALGRTSVACLPVLDPARLETELRPGLAEPGFGSHPRWSGRLAETGALARQLEQPLISALIATEGTTAAVRIAARLVELARLLAAADGAAPWTLGFSPATSIGVGAVQTARGLLLHHVGVRDGRVTRYDIVAPTEWNFEPEGVLSQGLVGQSTASADAARRAARILVQALDPCVACRVELSHA